MSVLNNKIDFTVVFSVNKANPNGDPLYGNRPRVDYNGMGEVSDVCIKRKIRNRLQDMGERIFVQSDDRSDDGCRSLRERADACAELKAIKKDNVKYAETACREWMDVRSFGQVFAFKGKDDKVSVGVRGPVTVQTAVSVIPIESESIQITKSVNGETSETKTPDTMGMKHRVGFAVYRFNGSINVQLAEKTGFSEEDAEKIHEAIKTLFENDCSSARPEGSMEMLKVFWWKHNCKSGQYSSAKVHRTVTIDATGDGKSVEDYTINYKPLEGLDVDIYDGLQ